MKNSISHLPHPFVVAALFDIDKKGVKLTQDKSRISSILNIKLSFLCTPIQGDSFGEKEINEKFIMRKVKY